MASVALSAGDHTAAVAAMAQLVVGTWQRRREIRMLERALAASAATATMHLSRDGGQRSRADSQ
jgi:hypothetical protein